MAQRKIISIDHEKCNGCGVCIPNCPEGAIQIIDGKARLISDLFCDGLGACIGHCPQEAITIQEREAEQYDERKVMGTIIKQGDNVIRAHLLHLKEHHQAEYLHEALAVLKEKNIKIDLSQEFPCHGSGGPAVSGGCPGSKVMDFRQKAGPSAQVKKAANADSELRQWPIQLMLVPVHAPYLNNADLLIAADCVPFAYAGFHQDLLKGKTLLVGCPKFDDLGIYQQKLGQIFEHHTILSVTYAHMEVPCCFGLVGVIQDAIARSGKKVLFKEVVIGIQGEKIR